MPERQPLELTVYPKGMDPYGTPVYLDRGELGYRESDVDRWARAKRLTGPELAAEWHRAASLESAAMHNPGGYRPGAQQRAAIQRNTLHRFAAHDHYDQEDQ